MDHSSNWHHHDVELPKNDNEYFARMSHVIFMSGLNWRVLDKKWPGIKSAFSDFDLSTVAAFQEPEIEELMMNPDVIHNLPKIRAIVANAKDILNIVKEHGSFQKYLAELRKTGGEQGLRDTLSKRFAFLGKGTTVIFLFSVGEDLPEAHKEWESRHQK